MPPPSPTVARMELSLRLRQHRERLGIEAKTVAGWLGFSPNYLSAVENDRSVLAEEKLLALLERYEIDDHEQKELVDLRNVAKQRGWWSDYSGLIDNDLLHYYGLEHGASSIRQFESLVIPGHLQTKPYTRALAYADPAVSEMAAEQYVRLRQRRQERLSGEEPLRLTALVSQAALMQQVAGPAVQHEQLTHLLNVLEEHPDTVEFRVLPFTSSPGELVISSTLIILEFAHPHLPTLVRQDAFPRGQFINEPPIVHYVSSVYGQALAESLSVSESRALVVQLRDEFG